LSGVHSGTPVSVLELDAGHRLAVMLTRCTGASAYVVNRRAAAAFAEGLLPMSLPYDHICDQGWRFDLKVRIVTPTPCVHDDRTESTIGAPPARERNFHWTRRLSTFRYRIGNECRRFAYGLGQLLRAKFG
ncbi:MAG: hypothetical protein KGI35_14410, partial [Burkholderiales bacterium]|nr:hypothetical protein [Burkholderiales bacterium]